MMGDDSQYGARPQAVKSGDVFLLAPTRGKALNLVRKNIEL